MLTLSTFALSNTFITKSDLIYFYNIKTKKCENATNLVIDSVKLDLLNREIFLLNKKEISTGSYSILKYRRKDKIILFGTSLEACETGFESSFYKEQFK